MKLFVLTCSVEGCEECGNSHNIVGVFDTSGAAVEAEIQHQENHKNFNTHLHYPYTAIKTVELNTVNKCY
jgi:hypothetical protein